MKRRPEKIRPLKGEIVAALDSGRYRIQQHCKIRMHERGILEVEALHVLRHGRHEKRKDRFAEEYQAWHYAVRGKTPDLARELRIVISFVATVGMLLITAIELGEDDRT